MSDENDLGEAAAVAARSNDDVDSAEDPTANVMEILDGAKAMCEYYEILQDSYESLSIDTLKLRARLHVQKCLLPSGGGDLECDCTVDGPSSADASAEDDPDGTLTYVSKWCAYRHGGCCLHCNVEYAYGSERNRVGNELEEAREPTHEDEAVGKDEAVCKDDAVGKDEVVGREVEAVGREDEAVGKDEAVGRENEAPSEVSDCPGLNDDPMWQWCAMRFGGCCLHCISAPSSCVGSDTSSCGDTTVDRETVSDDEGGSTTEPVPGDDGAPTEPVPGDDGAPTAECPETTPEAKPAGRSTEDLQ